MINIKKDIHGVERAGPEVFRFAGKHKIWYPMPIITEEALSEHFFPLPVCTTDHETNSLIFEIRVQDDAEELDEMVNIYLSKHFVQSGVTHAHFNFARGSTIKRVINDALDRLNYNSSNAVQLSGDLVDLIDYHHVAGAYEGWDFRMREELPKRMCTMMDFSHGKIISFPITYPHSNVPIQVRIKRYDMPGGLCEFTTDDNFQSYNEIKETMTTDEELLNEFRAYASIILC